MAEPEKPTQSPESVQKEPARVVTSCLAHYAAKASWLVFFLALCALMAATAIRPFEASGIPAVVLAGVGFLLGLVALVVAKRVGDPGASNALAIMIMNALLLFGVGNALFETRRYWSTYGCMTNPRQIHGAKLAWALEKGKTTNDMPAEKDLFGREAYIFIKPTCPNGGSYEIKKIGQKATCSIHGALDPRLGQ